MNKDVIQMNVNGRAYALKKGRDYEEADTLSKVLREHFGLTGVRVSCEQGACGACTVLINGKSALSCMMLVTDADGCDILTIEGLDGSDPGLMLLSIHTDPEKGLPCSVVFVRRALLWKRILYSMKIQIPQTKKLRKHCQVIFAAAVAITESTKR